MQNNNKIKKAKLIKIGIALAGTIVGMYLFYKLSFYIMPFIFAFIIASIVEPLIRLLIKKLKMPRKVAAPITILFFLCILGLILTLIIIKLVDEIKSIVLILPDIMTNLYENIITWISKISTAIDWLPSEITDGIGNIFSELTKSLTSLLTKITKGAYTTAISIPDALIFIVITILATYFISRDREKISNFISSQLPVKWVKKSKAVINDIFSALLGYLKAQLIIMSITFIELLIGFFIIGVKYQLLLALIISIADALPVIGTGGFLIPWSIYSFFVGNFKLGVSLLILYGVITVVRQLIEPRIVGTQIGIHPLVALIAMYTGFKIFGVLGFIIGPILVLIIKNIITGILKNKPIKDLLESNGKDEQSSVIEQQTSH